MDRFEKIKKYLIKLYEENAVLEGELSHAFNTLDWVNKLSKDPSELLMIAAFSHDIDRVIQPRELQVEGESYDEYKKRHSERSAKLIKDIALKYNYDENEANIISELVRLHEVGGTEDANILQDADSISYFDNNLEIYLKRSGYDKTAEKVKWMFDRCSPRAQKVIKTLPMYKKFTELS